MSWVVVLASAPLFGAAASVPSEKESAQGKMKQARDALWSWRLGEAEQLLAQQPTPRAAQERELLLSQLDLLRSRHRAVIKRLTKRLTKLVFFE